MSLLRVADKAPEFSLPGVFHNKVADYRLAAYAGRWLVLFFYPADFTFICPTEVMGFSKLADDFAREDAAILGVSVDPIETHRAWGEELRGVEYPLLSDESKALSRSYGVLDEREGVSLRATFIINSTSVVSYVVISHVNVGRNVEETLRVLKALRTERLCPSEWKPGDTTGSLNLKY